jgi:hypothetical protein
VPEETCEDNALMSLVTKIGTDQAKKGAHCGCVDPSSTRDQWETFLDTVVNELIYCSPGVTIDPGGDDAGTAATHDEVAEHARLGVCLCHFEHGLAVCHAKAAKAALLGRSSDDGGCEAVAQGKFAECTTKLRPPLPACNDLSLITAVVQSTLDGVFAPEIYCSASPSGAFVR